MPTAQELADIATQAAEVARRLGYEPRVALLANSSFGTHTHERPATVRDAVRILDTAQCRFRI